MRFLAKANEVFDGDESTRKAEDDIDRNKTTKLKPGKCRTVHAKPDRLTDNHIRSGGNLGFETFMEEVNDGKDRTRESHEGKDKESPPGPDVGKCPCNDVVQTAPSSDHEEQCRNAERFEFKMLIH